MGGGLFDYMAAKHQPEMMTIDAAKHSRMGPTRFQQQHLHERGPKRHQRQSIRPSNNCNYAYHLHDEPK
jgi:hypothetical protein